MPLAPELASPSTANESLFFTNIFATGTRTVRGMEAITLSIPPTPGRSIVKRENNGGLFTIGEIFKEQGYDLVAMPWYALFAPAGTPNAIINNLAKAAIDAINDPVVKKKLIDMEITVRKRAYAGGADQIDEKLKMKAGCQ